MSYLENSTPGIPGLEDVTSQHSRLSGGSIPEDLLSKLLDFPHVPDNSSLHIARFPSVIHEDKDHILSHDMPSASCLVVDTTPVGRGLGVPSEEENNATSAFLYASQILRTHPGLIMEHFDPNTNVHTFKIACPPRPQDESLPYLSPITPSLSNSSSESSPLTPSMQTLPVGHLRSRSFRSAPSLSGDRYGLLTTSGGLRRIPSSASSSTADSLRSVLRGPPFLRRRASELSDRLTSLRSQHSLLQSNQTLPSSEASLPPYPPSDGYFSANERLARRFAHQATASPDSEENSHSRPLSGFNSRSSDPRRPRGSPFMSSDELLAFRKFLAQRAEDVLIDAHNLLDDSASDFSEYGGPIQSGRERHSGSHEHGSIRGRASPRHPTCNQSPPDPTSMSRDVEYLKSRSMKEDILHPLNIIRAEGELDPSNVPLLANGDTSLDLYDSPSSPVLALPYSRIGPAPTENTCFEMQNHLPDFLDLSPDLPQQITPKVHSRGETTSRLPTRDEGVTSVREGVTVNSSGDCKLKRVEGNRVDPVPTRLLPLARLGPRRVKSAAELVAGRPQYVHPPSVDRSLSQPLAMHRGSQCSDPCVHHAHHQVAPVRAVLSAGGKATGSYQRQCDVKTGPLVEREEPTCSQGTVESHDLWREDLTCNKRMQDMRPGDNRNRKRELRIAVDSSCSHESSPGVGSVFQRQRAIYPQNVTKPASPTRHQPRRSSSVSSSTPSASSFHGEGRYRTLNDRAYRHPDVPYSPLYSEHDYMPSPQGAGRLVSLPRDSPSRHCTEDRLLSSAKTGNTSPISPSGHSWSKVYSPKASTRLPKPRLHIIPSPSKNNPSSLREPVILARARQPGSSLDLRSPAPSIPAFLPPRPAPDPATRTRDKAKNTPYAAQRGYANLTAPTAGEAVAVGIETEGSGEGSSVVRKPADDARTFGVDSTRFQASNKPKHAGRATPGSYSVMATSPLGFSALSFRRHAWSKKQKMSPRSDGAAGYLRAAVKSEPNLNSSFISVVGHEVKPQRKGLIFKRKT
ncbi:hypothetical protein B0F90DRAFT_1699272 [Multifurca ochricompacta]|uniref:Uncharacterized protein n=1 Tax=Multifurca ochricompacta TaxID=376703 RepID=A0AAD4MAG2_9AGAM|nr:hypothetical protein B0F90DRAFT_1699272 [Multifurca ochricompacta]